MTKYLVLVDVDAVHFLRVKKGAKALITRNGRLYRNDSNYYVKDYLSSDALRINRMDSTQPVLTKVQYSDPDLTRVFIQSAKLSGNKKKIWLNMDSSKLWQYLTAIIVVGSLLYGFLSSGGF